MGLLDMLDEERGGLVPDALRYVFGVLSSSFVMQKGAAFRITEFLFLLARSIWTKYMTSLRSKMKLNLQSEKMRYQSSYLENQGTLHLKSDGHSGSVHSTSLPDH